MIFFNKIYKKFLVYSRLNPFTSIFAIACGIFIVGKSYHYVKRHLYAQNISKNKNSFMKVQTKNIGAVQEKITLDLMGITIAQDDVILKAQISGTINSIEKTKGQFVKKGEIILKFDDRDRQARYEEAKARYKQKDLEFTSAQKLSQQNFKAQNALSAALADRESALAALKRLEQELKDSQPQAPFDGYLENVHPVQGQTLAPSEPLAQIISLDPLYIEGFLPEKSIDDVSMGQKVSIIFPFMDNKSFDGEIDYVSKKSNEATRTYKIRAKFSNKDNILSVGMTGKIKIYQESQPVHKIHPSLMTLDESGIVGIKHINNDKKVIFTPIKILKSSSTELMISKIQDQLEIITAGSGFVLPGSVVDVENEERTADKVNE